MSASVRSRGELLRPTTDQPGQQTLPLRRGAARVSTRLERWLARQMLHYVGNPPLELILWDGQRIGPLLAEPPVTRIRLLDPACLWKMFWDPRYQFAEAYSQGRLEVEGDLVVPLVEAYRAWAAAGHRHTRAAPWCGWFHSLNAVRRARRDIHFHYDIGNEFYRWWLDQDLVYTCAYFARPGMSLEEAQQAKMEYVCRKLGLRPGYRVVEAGCGWGALALYMARHHGVHVRAYNISHQQILHARQRAAREGLQDRVEFIEDDWRSIHGRYDAFVSVGMLEHVGPANYRQLGRVIDRSLTRVGRGLIHTIGRNRPMRIDKWIETHIFPGGCPPALSQMMDVFEPSNFSVLDVENLRLHYATTLRHWRERFEAVTSQVAEMFDERFVRMWRLYLCGSIAAFETGTMQLFQVVFARSDDNRLPRTRTHLYRDATAAAGDGRLEQSSHGSAEPAL